MRREQYTEISALSQAWGVYYDYIGDKARSGYAQALATYQDEYATLDDLARQGVDVRNRMTLATLRYHQAVQSVNREIERQIEEERRAGEASTVINVRLGLKPHAPDFDARKREIQNEYEQRNRELLKLQQETGMDTSGRRNENKLRQIGRASCWERV